jgi:hypothetical protein
LNSSGLSIEDTDRVCDLFAPQATDNPSFVPTHIQVHELVATEKLETVPALQRLGEVFVNVDTLVPATVPQSPLTFNFAEQLAVVPVYAPVQLQVHGPVPENPETEPAEHRLGDVAANDITLDPSTIPHTPFAVLFAVPVSLFPPLTPVQVHVHGPAPENPETEPTEHRLGEVAVNEEKLPASAAPASPSIVLFTVAVHTLVVLVPVPVQVHVQAFAPVTKAEGVPFKQLGVGAVLELVVTGHWPSVVELVAVHLELLRVPARQYHSHGPDPERAVVLDCSAPTVGTGSVLA